MSISFNPNITTVAASAFLVASAGLVQGTAYPDPSTRWARKGGILASTETLPMWGGVAIYNQVPGASGGSVPVGTPCGRATTITGGTKPITGFSVFDGAYGMINSPQSPVPLAGTGGQVMYYDLGSRARIAVACDPVLAVALQGGLINQPVTWDLPNQKLIPVVSTTISSGTYNSTTGLVTLTLAATQNLSPGDTVTVSSATGTGSFASINGTFQAGTGTVGTTLTYTIATSLTLTISGGTVATTAALACEVLEAQSGTCITVSYNSVTGFATWNTNGSCAVIRI